MENVYHQSAVMKSLWEHPAVTKSLWEQHIWKLDFIWSENWSNFNYHRCEYDIDSIVSLFAEDKIDVMYKLFDDPAEKDIINKTVYDKDKTKKNKFIPDYIRKLLKTSSKSETIPSPY